jgi:hypothetical protein
MSLHRVHRDSRSKLMKAKSGTRSEIIGGQTRSVACEIDLFARGAQNKER